MQSRATTRRTILAGLLLALLVTAGCRNVWVHPEATAEKYNSDLYLCKYGTPQPTAEEYANPNRVVPKVRRDWKLCMAAQGWELDTRHRSSKPYASK